MVRRVVIADDPTEETRYAIYVEREQMPLERIAETNQAGIGIALTTLMDEGQIRPGDRVGIRDRVERKWIIGPYRDESTIWA